MRDCSPKIEKSNRKGKRLADKFEDVPCEYWGCGFEQRK